MKVRCKNCRLEFSADDDSRVDQCPRCSSAHLDKQREFTAPRPAVASAPKVYSATGAIIQGDTKDAWKSFHTSATSAACPRCGGKEFERNFKRKEKTCKNCGEILPLPRKFV